MRLSNLITGALMIKLLSDVVKKSRENDRDIFDMLKEYNDNRRKGKSAGSSQASYSQANPPPASAQNTPPSRVNSPDKTEPQSRPSPVYRETVRPVPAKPDMDVPDYFTPYEGADMTCAEADAAGFEFEGADRYHGVDFWLSAYISDRRDSNEDILFVHNGPYNGAGIPGCAITGWHGSDKTVKIPRSINGRPVVKIEKEAFKEKNIREVYLPDSVIEIGEKAFYECSSLEYARLSKGLVRIGNGAFFYCKALKKVYLGGVRDIGANDFGVCKSLTALRLPEIVEMLGSGALSETGLEKLYWNKIIHAGGSNLSFTPYEKAHDFVLFGDCLQHCSIKTEGEIIIDDPAIKVIGSCCFFGTSAAKVTLSDNVRELESCAFNTVKGDNTNKIEEIYGPGLKKFGFDCFKQGQKVTVSGDAEYVGNDMAAKGYLYIEPDSFKGTNMEKPYAGGSAENPCVCTMVRSILADVIPFDGYSRFYHKILPQYEFAKDKAAPREILTLSEDGSTLIMDDRVEYTVADHIPNLGAKKLIVSSNMHTMYSFESIQDFEEIVFQNPVIRVRKKSYFRPKKSVIIRFKIHTTYNKKAVDSVFLLYLPPVRINSEETERLRNFYDKCLGTSFDFALYDREILDHISSYRTRFTIARLRLEGEFQLNSEARERYENFLLFHKRKAEFTAKKHGDTALLSLLEKLSENNNDPKGDVQK